MADPRAQLEVHPHHEQRKICASRAKYRDGRKPRAVKVYTINLESRYLLVQGVPAIGVMKELIEQFALFGAVEEYNPLDEYPAEQFTEVYLVKFQRLQSARVAKRKLDECSFFGGVLHVCYAPEFESVQETREKLQDRRRYVARATADKDCQSTERRKPAAETSSSVSAPMESKFVGSSTWGPAPQPDDFLPLQPSLPTESYQEYTLSSTSDSYSNNLSCGDGVHPFPCSRLGRAMNTAQEPVASSPARFMPRTTQLQERQRRRGASLALSLSLSDSPEVVIGPKLPELPKLDLEDDSLNTSAKFIRGKLQKVSEISTIAKPEATETNAPVEATETNAPVEATETNAPVEATGTNAPVAPPVKQRRRI